MRMRKLIMLFLLMSIGISLATNGGGAQTGLAFLKIGVGARSTAMGGAYSAVVSDAYATYWNPAGLLSGSQSNVAFMHNEWIQGMTSEYVALQLQSGNNSGFAFHLYTLSVGDIQVRTIPSENPLQNTDATNLSAGISYARRLTPEWDAGITVKYLFEKIFIETASGGAVDFGLRYHPENSSLRFALVLQNMGKMNSLQSEETVLPFIVRVGAMYRVNQLKGPLQLILSTDVEKIRFEDTRIHVGSELGFHEQVFLRVGYVSGYESRTFSFGAGIRKSAFRFNYSLTPFKDDLNTGHRFSLILQL